jgi:ribose transport system substrate-binding protein
MKMKSVLKTLSALCIALLLLCGAVVSAQDTFVVGYSAAGLIDELQVTWSENLQSTVEAAGGTVIVVDSQNDIAKQIADIEDLLAQGIDYLVINPVDEAGIVPAVEAANAAGVPVITIDRASAGGEVAAHITFDNYRAGYDAGIYIAEQSGGVGNVAQLEGQAGTSVARERGQGFRDAIAQYPDMAIVLEQPTDWSAAEGLSATEDLLVSTPDLVGIWAHADAIIMGAVQALDAAGLNDQVTTVGMGMYGGGPESIQAGGLDASWELFPAQLGTAAGQAVVALAQGQDVNQVINTPMVFVTGDNIADVQAMTPPPVIVRPFRVGYSAAGLIDVLQVTWSEAVAGAVEAAGGEAIILDSQNDIAKQISDIEDLLTQGIDALVINPVDEAGIGVAIAAANAAGVPVVTIDRNGGEGDITSRVGFDNYRAGFEAGEYIAAQNNYTGQVAQLQGMPGGADVRERSQGFQDAIAQYPDMEIVYEPYTNWDTAEAQAATEDLIASNPDVVGIWAHADSVIMGAVQALEAAGLSDQVTTVGMGMFAGGPEAIADGTLDASWELYPVQLGQTAGNVVVAIVAGQQVEDFVRTPMTFVTGENIAQFLSP